MRADAMILDGFMDWKGLKTKKFFPAKKRTF
jgi:hypothetical protein